MLEKVNELIKEIEGVEKYLMGMFSLTDLAGADEETIKLFQTYAKLMEISKEIMIEQAKDNDEMKHTLQDINTKLDQLLVQD